MFEKIINGRRNMKEEYTSWYDLSRKDASDLEKKFLSNDMGRSANDAMHICIVIGVIVFVICTIILEVLAISGGLNPYNFVVMILFILVGMIIVVGSTIEYHVKFNSWLKVKYRIIKK